MSRKDQREVQRKLRVLQHAERAGHQNPGKWELCSLLASHGVSGFMLKGKANRQLTISLHPTRGFPP